MQSYTSVSRNDFAVRYGLAILAAMTALLIRELLSPFLGQDNPYHTVWAAVVFSAWYCGLGPSIVTTLLGGIGVWYSFLPYSHSFELQDPKTEISGMLGYLFFASLIVALAEANRRSRQRSLQAEEHLRKAHEELERKVQERTTELKLANENLGELSGRLQQIRDEERRQIARELHDSVGQMIAALSMNVSVFLLGLDPFDPFRHRCRARRRPHAYRRRDRREFGGRRPKALRSAGDRADRHGRLRRRHAQISARASGAARHHRRRRRQDDQARPGPDRPALQARRSRSRVARGVRARGGWIGGAVRAHPSRQQRGRSF